MSDLLEIIVWYAAATVLGNKLLLDHLKLVALQRILHSPAATLSCELARAVMICISYENNKIHALRIGS